MIDLDCLDGIDIIDDSNEATAAARTLASSSEFNSPSQPILSSSMSEKDSNLLTCMLITANVGTIFEEVSIQQPDTRGTKTRPSQAAGFFNALPT